jgi:hypothetical protein
MADFTVTEEMSPYGAKINRERLARRAQPIAPPEPPTGATEQDMEIIDLPPVPPEVMAQAEQQRYAPPDAIEPVSRDMYNLEPDVAEHLLGMTRWSVMAMKRTSTYETRQIARLAQEIYEAKATGNIPFQYPEDEEGEDYDGEEGVGR